MFVLSLLFALLGLLGLDGYLDFSDVDLSPVSSCFIVAKTEEERVFDHRFRLHCLLQYQILLRRGNRIRHVVGDDCYEEVLWFYLSTYLMSTKNQTIYGLPRGYSAWLQRSRNRMMHALNGNVHTFEEMVDSLGIASFALAPLTYADPLYLQRFHDFIGCCLALLQTYRHCLTEDDLQQMRHGILLHMLAATYWIHTDRKWVDAMFIIDLLDILAFIKDNELIVLFCAMLFQAFDEVSIIDNFLLLFCDMATIGSHDCRDDILDIYKTWTRTLLTKSGYAQVCKNRLNKLMHALNGNIELFKMFQKIISGIQLSKAEIEYVQHNSISRKIVRYHYPAFEDGWKVGALMKKLKKIRSEGSRDAAYLRTLRRYDQHDLSKARRAAKALRAQVESVDVPIPIFVPKQTLLVKQNERFATLDLDGTLSDVRDIYNFGLQPVDRGFTRKQFHSYLRTLVQRESEGELLETQVGGFVESVRETFAFFIDTKVNLFDPIKAFCRKPAEILGDILSLLADIYASIKLHGSELVTFLTMKFSAWVMRFSQWVKDDTPIVRLVTWLAKLIKAGVLDVKNKVVDLFETQGDDEHPALALFHLLAHMFTGYGEVKLNKDRADRISKLFGSMNTLHTFCSKFWNVIVEVIDWLSVEAFDRPFFGGEPETLRKKLQLSVVAMRDVINNPPLEMTVESSLQYMVLFSEIEPLYAELITMPEIASRWVSWINYYRKFELIIARARNFINSANLRQVPIFYVFTGGSGIGKSGMINKTSHDIQMLHYGNAQPPFVRSIDESSLKYWNGYERQRVVYFEELFGLDTKDLQRSVSGECLKISSCTRFIVPMADVESKGNVDFTSPIVLATTNLPEYVGNLSGLQYPGAMARRWRWIKVEIDPKYENEFDTTVNQWRVPLGEDAYKRYLYTICELRPDAKCVSVTTVPVKQVDYSGLLAEMDKHLLKHEDEFARMLKHTTKLSQADLIGMTSVHKEVAASVQKTASAILYGNDTLLKVDESFSSPPLETQGWWENMKRRFGVDYYANHRASLILRYPDMGAQFARLEIAGLDYHDFLDLHGTYKLQSMLSYLPPVVIAAVESHYGDSSDARARMREAVVNEVIRFKTNKTHTDIVQGYLDTLVVEPDLKPTKTISEFIWKYFKLFMMGIGVLIAGAFLALWYFGGGVAETQSGYYEKSLPRPRKAKIRLNTKVRTSGKAQDNLQAQNSDKSLEEQLELITGAYSKATLVDASGSPCLNIGKVFCLCADIFVVNMHFLDPIVNSNGEIDDAASFVYEGRRAILFSRISWAQLVIDDVEQDLVFLKLPESVVGRGRDLRHLFFHKADFDQRVLGNVLKITPTKLGGYSSEKVLTGKWRGSFEKRADSIVTATVDNEKFEYVNSHAIMYDLATKRGDCMDIYAVENAKSPKKFFGFHVAGVGNQAACAILCREWIDYIVDLLNNSPEVGMTQGSLLVFDKEPKIIQMSEPTSDRYVPDGFQAVGRVTDKKYWNVPPKESQIVRTELFPDAVIERKPAALAPVNGESPLMNSIARAGCVDVDNKSGYTQVVLDAARLQFKKAVSLCKLPGKLSVEEALNTHINSESLTNIRFSTSPGFGCREAGKLGKSAYMTENSKESQFAFSPTKLTLDSLKFVEDEILVHQRIPIIPYNLTMKDELRELGKVMRPRLFFAGNFILLVLMRQYFGAFMETFLANPMLFRHSVGLDINGPFGDYLAHVVKDDVASYDIRKNDLTIWRYKLLAAWKLASDFMDDVDHREYEQGLGLAFDEMSRRCKMRKTLISMHIDWYFVIYETVVHADHGMPSGDPFTTIFNTLIDHMEFLENVLHLTRGKQPLLYEKLLHDPEFLWNIPAFNFGDDLIAHSLGFTLEEYMQAGMELHQREYTAPDKDRGTKHTVGEIFYLSRVPITSHGRIHYVLPERTLDAIPLWRWKSVIPNSEMYPILCEAALAEWFHYGKDRFVAKKELFDSELARCGFKRTSLTWAKAMSDWQSHHL